MTHAEGGLKSFGVLFLIVYLLYPFQTTSHKIILSKANPMKAMNSARPV